MRLFFQAHRPPAAVELDNTVTLGIPNLIREHRRAGLAGSGGAQVVGKAGAVENVIAERERHAVGADERPADEECLRQAPRARLHFVRD